MFPMIIFNFSIFCFCHSFSQSRSGYLGKETSGVFSGTVHRRWYVFKRAPFAAVSSLKAPACAQVRAVGRAAHARVDGQAVEQEAVGRHCVGWLHCPQQRRQETEALLRGTITFQLRAALLLSASLFLASIDRSNCYRLFAHMVAGSILLLSLAFF
jgi:hypothetical protein